MSFVAPQKYFPVSWEELHRNAKALAWKLHELGKPWKGIIAVTRGGLVPATIVARELDIRVIETVSVIGYRANDAMPAQRDQLSIVKEPANVGDGEGWLVVDDLVDTGRTLEALRKMLPKAHFAVIYAKPSGKPLVDTFVTEVSQETWIYFPWDIELQFTQPISVQRDGKSKK
ncbi:MAG: xanthine phosphoribosyltransferase [Alphaproteobacteria bacterium]|nr:xanthine phosphoribosyltransferase [Alphaproteobacteria bacterium]